MFRAERLPTVTGSPDAPPPDAATVEDVACVLALRRGEPHGARAFFERFAPMVERVLIHAIGPDGEIPDLMQDVFSKALSGVVRLEEAAAVRGWLSSIAIFTARSFLRRRSLRSRFEFLRGSTPDWAAPPTHDAEAAEALKAFYRVLDQLSADLRIVFVLRHLEQRHNEDIAAAIGKSTMTVKRRAAKAEERFVRLAQKQEALASWLVDDSWRRKWNRKTNDSQT